MTAAGKYTKRKIEIESEMQRAVDTLRDTYRNLTESNANLYNPETCAERNSEAAEKYEQAAGRERDRAIAREVSLFDDMRRDLAAALSKAPTQDQLAYLQVLTMKNELTTDDVRQAFAVVGGNALAESALSDIATRTTGSDSAMGLVPSAPSLSAITQGLDKFQHSRATSISRYGTAADSALGDDLHTLCFMPDGSNASFDAAEAAIAAYGA